MHTLLLLQLTTSNLLSFPPLTYILSFSYYSCQLSVLIYTYISGMQM